MKAVPVVAICPERTEWHPTITRAAASHGVSRYVVVTCCFTGFPAVDGTFFDLDVSVSAEQEEALRRSWVNCRTTSSVRRIVRRRIHGQP